MTTDSPWLRTPSPPASAKVQLVARTAGLVSVTARCAFTFPFPSRSAKPRLIALMLSQVTRSCSPTLSGPHVGCLALISEATEAATGHDIEVPVALPYWLVAP